MSDIRNKILQEVRSFFKTISWKKILTFLFFVILSSTFWMMQVYRQKFESTITIPVKYVNIPDSIVFEHELPENVYARIKDDGAAMFRYYFTKRKDSLTVDIRDLVNGSPQERVIQGRNFEQLIRGKLFFTSELLSYSPTRVSYAYSVLRQKKLSVLYDGYVSLAPGLLLDGELTLIPDSIIAYGSKASLDTLHYALTKGDTLRNIKADKTVKIEMRDIPGVKYVPNTVELNILVDNFVEKELEVPVECVNLPQNLSIKIFPSSVKIPILVGRKRYSSITADNFKVIIDYDDLKDFKDQSIPVRITESPDYIQTKIPIPSEVEFVLEQK